MTTATDTTTDEAQHTATSAWHLFDGAARYGALLGDWATSTTDSGQPITTARIHGQHAAAALHRFAATYNVILGTPGDQHPVLAYTEPGIEVAWRNRGVWIRLLAAA